MTLSALLIATALLGDGCKKTKEIRSSRDQFLERVAAGDNEGAYALLTEQRRADMGQDEFDVFIDHSVFRSEGNYELPYEQHPGHCMDGYVPQPDGDWYIQLFFIEEADRMRVHSLALQQPTPVHLGTLLPECGYWKGTLSGYSGPPVFRATKPTSR